MATKQPPSSHGKAPVTGKGQVSQQPNPGHSLGPSKHIPVTGK